MFIFLCILTVFNFIKPTNWILQNIWLLKTGHLIVYLTSKKTIQLSYIFTLLRISHAYCKNISAITKKEKYPQCPSMPSLPHVDTFHYLKQPREDVVSTNTFISTTNNDDTTSSSTSHLPPCDSTHGSSVPGNRGMICMINAVRRCLKMLRTHSCTQTHTHTHEGIRRESEISFRSTISFSSHSFILYPLKMPLNRSITAL